MRHPAHGFLLRCGGRAHEKRVAFSWKEGARVLLLVREAAHGADGSPLGTDRLRLTPYGRSAPDRTQFNSSDSRPLIDAYNRPVGTFVYVIRLGT